MKKIISLVLTGLLSASLFAGCAGNSNSNNQSNSETNESSSTSAKTESTDSETPKTVTMANGEKELPTEFGNFALLDWYFIENCQDLGVLPVAASLPAVTSHPENLDTLASLAYVDGHARLHPDISVFDGIESLNASDDGIDIEQLLALDLDYIITTESNIEHADKLEMVAPTYFLPNSLSTDADGYRDWKQQHLIIGELVGEPELAAQQVAEYEALVESYMEQIGDSIKDKSAMVFQVSTKGVQYSTITHQQIYAELGFELPELLVDADISGTIALENLATINPDYIFVNVESLEDFATYEASPIWQNLTAVQNGHVFEFAHNVWNRSNGSRANLYQLQDAAEFVIDGTQVTKRFELNQ